TSLTVNEGGVHETFKVKLDARPAYDRTISLSLSSSLSSVTVDTDTGETGNQTTMTLTPSNWNSENNVVTVKAAHDSNKVDETGTITVSGDGITSGSVNVKVIDDDKNELVLSPTSLKVSEGRTNTFTVKLAKNPGATRKVTLTSNNAEVTVDAQSTAFGKQNSLTFNSSNWHQAQTVTVYTAQDDDKVDDTVTINLTGTDIAAGSVGVTVLDDDVGLRWSNFPSTIQEGGSETFSIKLDKWPGNNRTINLSSSNSDVKLDTNPDEAGNQTALTLTDSNWREVTVRAAPDADAANDKATISLLMSESGFSYLLNLEVTDDDVGLNLTTPSLTIVESHSKTFSVRLNSRPSAEVTITLARTGSSDVRFDTKAATTGYQNKLTFTTSNWNTAQEVTVSAASDVDKLDDTARINLTGAGVAAETVPVTVLDDDFGLTVLPSSLTIPEGSAKTFTVALSTWPGNNRTIDLIRIGSSDVTTNPTSLTFTASNWSVAQTVTVSADHDDDKTNDVAWIDFYISSVLFRWVRVSVTDDDVGLDLETSSLTIVEGRSENFEVKLADNPGSTQTVTLKSNNADVTVDKTSLTFTPANWSTVQTVTVSAASDGDKVDDTARINLTGTGVGTATVRVTVLDDDIRLTLSPSSLTIPEGGSKTFTVRLNTDTWPGNNRTINLTSTNSDVTVDTDTSVSGNQTSLTLTASNWNTGRTVTVRAAHDGDKTNDSAVINLNGSGVVSASLGVNVTDDDVSLDLNTSSLKIVEGRSRTFRVRLAENPGSTQTVTLTSDNADVTVDTNLAPESGRKNTLTFNSSNWNQRQTVRVYTDHDDDKADAVATITLKGTGVATDTVSVKVLDDDIRLTLSPSSLTIPEGGSETFTVRPDTGAWPGNNRTIKLTRSTGSSDVTVNPTSLTFTASNWTRPQTVTVSAATDADKVDDTATIKLNDDGVRTKYLNVKVLDDEIGLTLVPTSLTVNEGGVHETFKVKLDARPAYDRTISL
ncbi:MAG: hypothetical protein ISN29_03540, partial [Gammaproteobacteria bacterium AqS3]|nr:hypothetical protein [Gammaproteobacteria bacterium AqS3]